MFLLPPLFTLFPYTTLFRSGFGVEVHGASLSAELEAPIAGLLRELFDEHHLLLFRGEDLTSEDQVRVCSYLRPRSEEHTSELQSPCNLVCRLLLEKKTTSIC